ncbi:hypothetical protein L552_2029 [Bordetella pertussis I002]|nr:hypothetical protein L552_2029 [Bordetella pertussis I002]
MTLDDLRNYRPGHAAGRQRPGGRPRGHRDHRIRSGGRRPAGPEPGPGLPARQRHAGGAG